MCDLVANTGIAMGSVISAVDAAPVSQLDRVANRWLVSLDYDVRISTYEESAMTCKLLDRIRVRADYDLDVLRADDGSAASPEARAIRHRWWVFLFQVAAAADTIKWGGLRIIACAIDIDAFIALPYSPDEETPAHAAFRIFWEKCYPVLFPSPDVTAEQ